MQTGNIFRVLAVAGILCASIGNGHAQTFRGVNLPSAAFASGKIPGRYGYDYLFPKDTVVQYYTQQGANIFRLSILWERLQPALNGPLDTDYLLRIQQFVETAQKSGAKTIIDLHNYGNYRGQQIGSPEVSPQAFVDLWQRLAKTFAPNGNVFFGLMNEPKLSSAQAWADVQQLAIDAIRNVGAKNTILVSGIKWDSAQHLPQDNGDALISLHDPQNDLLFEVHEYFDGDASGTKPDCVSPDQAVARLAPATDWFKAHNVKGFLGEFGASRTPECLQALGKVASYLKENRGSWAGWTYWAGGPLWGEYMFTIEPTRSGDERPQMTVLTPFFKNQ